MLNEISQSEKDKYHMISLICEISWTKWTSRDRLIDSGMTAIGGGWLGGGGMQQKGKRTHGHWQQCGDCSEGGGIREINGNGKIQLK